VLVKNIDIIGFYWGSYQKHKPDVLRRSFQQLFRWFEEGKLRPHISHRLPLDLTANALRLLQERKSTGKVILELV
jgi:NADPH2:quinone reductase